MNQKLIDVFKDTKNFFAESPEIISAMVKSEDNTHIYPTNLYPQMADIGPQFQPGEIRVTKNRTFEAAIKLHKEFPNRRIAVLNFASATNPGGGVKSGSSAQEESLCRCSTLYPCLTMPWVKDIYYEQQKSKKPLHTNACIYSPDIVICKTDTDDPQRMPPEDWVTVDVITCAAPNLRTDKNGNNVETGEPFAFSKSDLFHLHESRATHILQIAAANKVDILVLGAFGCGAFANDPHVVAQAYNEVLPDFIRQFEIVEFAVYCRDQETQNYKAFKEILG